MAKRGKDKKEPDENEILREMVDDEDYLIDDPVRVSLDHPEDISAPEDKPMPDIELVRGIDIIDKPEKKADFTESGLEEVTGSEAKEMPDMEQVNEIAAAIAEIKADTLKRGREEVTGSEAKEMQDIEQVNEIPAEEAEKKEPVPDKEPEKVQGVVMEQKEEEFQKNEANETQQKGGDDMKTDPPEEKVDVVPEQKKKGKGKTQKQQDALSSLLIEQNEGEDIEDGLIDKPPWRPTDYQLDDEKRISKLFSGDLKSDLPIPKKKDEPKTIFDKDFMRLGKSPDSKHKEDLNRAFFHYPEVHRKRTIKLAIIGFIVIIILILLFFKYDLIGKAIPVYRETDAETFIQDETYEQISYYNETINKLVEEEISFAAYDRQYDNKEIKVIGFLKYEYVNLNTQGVYDNIYSVVDDFGAEIILTSLSKEQKLLFRRDVVTSALFEVTGIFKFSGREKELSVSRISEAERPTTIVEETITKQKIA